MKYSEDAHLQAAATIVAAQITAKTFPVEIADEGMVASALASALREVANGWKRWEEESARDTPAIPGRFAIGRAPDKPRRE
jgi:hypothetical protein